MIRILVQPALNGRYREPACSASAAEGDRCLPGPDPPDIFSLSHDGSQTAGRWLIGNILYSPAGRYQSPSLFLMMSYALMNSRFFYKNNTSLGQKMAHFSMTIFGTIYDDNEQSSSPTNCNSNFSYIAAFRD